MPDFPGPGSTITLNVEATFQLHCEQGVAETSMADIPRRAGVSVGTVKSHFSS
jgi:AcrR family transcriptional regulator